MVKGPFVGSAPFQEDDAAVFFGRDDETRVIIANLQASRLTILYGESGVGKSSLLNAKVLPSLRAVKTFPVATLATWSGDPVASLRASIAETLGVLPVSGERLVHCVRRGATRLTNSRLLLVLDQFEEYFQYRSDDDTFQDEFTELLVADDLPVNALLAVREDVLSALDVFQDTILHLFDNYLRLLHLTKASAMLAIERPVASYNEATGSAVRLEQGLADAVVQGIVGAADRVPGIHLQVVMSTLWDEDADGGTLHLGTLNRLGGVHRIFRTHFDIAIRDGLAPEERDVAARLFDRLVTPSGRKQVQTLSDLTAVGKSDRVPDVLKKLSARRVIGGVPAPKDAAPDEPAYEFVHDVVARAALEWQSARALEQEQHRTEVQRRSAMKFKFVSALLAVVILMAAIAGTLAWYQTAAARREREALAQSEQQRLKAERLVLAAQADLLAAQQSALNEAQRAAEADNQAEAARQLAQARENEALLAHLRAERSETEALESSHARQEAAANAQVMADRLRAERALAHAIRLTAAGGSLIRQTAVGEVRSSEDLQTALALAIYAVGNLLQLNERVPPGIETFLRQAASANSRVGVFTGKPQEYSMAPITWSPDGTKLYVPATRVIAGLDGSTLLRGITGAAWNRDGSVLAFVRASGRNAYVSTREERAGGTTRTRELTDLDTSFPVKWNADLSWFATPGRQTEIGDLLQPVVLGMLDGTLIQNRVVPSLNSYDWSPDGTMLLIQGANARTDRSRIYRIVRPSGEITSLPPIPSDRHVTWDSANRPVAISARAQVDVFSTATGELQQSEERGPGYIGFPVAVHPKGLRYIASASEGTLFIWDSEAKQRSVINIPNPINVTVRSIAWSRDGSKVAFHVTSSAVNDVLVHDAAFALAGTPGGLLAVASRYLQSNFRLSEEACRRYFEGGDCPSESDLRRWAK